MSNLVVAAVFFVLYVSYRRRDRRLLRNGVFLVGAAWFALSAALELLTKVVPGFGWVTVALLLLAPFAVLVLAVFLIGNGLTMIRSEGRSLGNLLSLIAGVAIIALPLLALSLVRSQQPLAVGAAMLLFFVSSYLGVVFVIFLVYSLVYGRMTADVVPSTIVVLGSRVIDGRVPPLLKSRLDKALTVYQQTAAAGTAPLLIPSGGRGRDESVSEGEAMAEYLVGQGADPRDVRPEVAATNTRSNLVLSRDIQQSLSRTGPTLVVTNNYHVLRTAILARQLGSDAQVVGSPTARYYIPSAFLREFVAIVAQHRVLHAVLCLPFVVLTVAFVLVLHTQRL